MSSNLLWKSFNICFSKFKCFPTITFSPPPANLDELGHNSAVAAADVPPLVKNFNSLYDVNCSDTSTTKSLTCSSSTTTATGAAATEDFFSSSDDDSDTDSVPDFTSAFASHRFFFASPGTSKYIFERPEPPPEPSMEDSGAIVSGGIALQTYSPDPYSDFRESMMEMVEARGLGNVTLDDWEFLHELLLCYLTLNPKHIHKFIIGAFADVVVSLFPSAPPEAACRKTHLGKHCSLSQSSV